MTNHKLRCAVSTAGPAVRSGATMAAVDLFAGLGGFTCGAEAAGVNVVWAANHWQAAKLIRAAAAVVEAAMHCEQPEANNVDMPVRRARLRKALAAFEKAGK